MATAEEDSTDLLEAIESLRRTQEAFRRAFLLQYEPPCEPPKAQPELHGDLW